MNARDFAKRSMHCFHLIPLLRDEVSSAAPTRVRSLKGLDNLPRAAHLESGKLVLLDPPASTQGTEKAERRFWKLCEGWEWLTEVRRMHDEKREVGGGLVMRPRG